VRRAKGFAAAVFVFFVAVAGISAYAMASALARASAAPSSSAVSAGTFVSPVCTTLVKVETSQGYSINTFLSSTSAKIGDQVCINIILQNIDGRNLTVSSDGGLTIAYNVTEKDGAVVFHDSCTELSQPTAGGTAASEGPIGSWSCGTFWNTGSEYNGIVPGPGTYDLIASVDVPNVVGQGLSVVYSYATMSLSK
jgi:hypothetical protein